MISYKAIETKYCVKVSKEDFLKILNHDAFCTDKDIEPLWGMLDEIEGVIDVDYSGHFGANIYITLDKDFDNGSTWNLIEQNIEVVTK